MKLVIASWSFYTVNVLAVLLAFFPIGRHTQIWYDRLTQIIQLTAKTYPTPEPRSLPSSLPGFKRHLGCIRVISFQREDNPVFQFPNTLHWALRIVVPLPQACTESPLQTFFSPGVRSLNSAVSQHTCSVHHCLPCRRGEDIIDIAHLCLTVLFWGSSPKSQTANPLLVHPQTVALPEQISFALAV